jgi:hypothetical protein
MEGGSHWTREVFPKIGVRHHCTDFSIDRHTEGEGDARLIKNAMAKRDYETARLVVKKGHQMADGVLNEKAFTKSGGTKDEKRASVVCFGAKARIVEKVKALKIVAGGIPIDKQDRCRQIRREMTEPNDSGVRLRKPKSGASTLCLISRRIEGRHDCGLSTGARIKENTKGARLAVAP